MPSRTAISDPIDPKARAKEASLRYVADDRPGITRRRSGRGFTYRDPAGNPVSAADRARIDQLVIPPAWTDVWICPLANGHLQATGRDDRGRKQYLYHPRWRDISNRTKFDRMLEFGHFLPKIRQRVRRDMAARRLTRDAVVGTVIALLDHTAMRIGNVAYAKENGSFGLTTLQDRHVRFQGRTARLRFRGKGGKLLNVDVSDPRIARMVQRCEEIPGQELFQYEDEDGEFRTLESSDVNEYLRSIAQQPFTAKDFRTWKASALVAEAIYRRLDDCPKKADAKRIVAEAIRETARSLGNTVATCRKYYVHPGVTDLFLKGELSALCDGFRPRSNRKWMDAADQILLHVLKEITAANKVAA